MTALVRKDLRASLKAATDGHPGLLLQRGWTDYVKTDASNEGAGGKSEHLDRICKVPAGDLYSHSYERWLNNTKDASRFSQLAMKVEGRLLIGLAGGGALETGCAVHHTYGVPYLPGSSIKGVVRGWLQRNKPEWKDNPILDDLFGTTDLSGLVSFHDAWWIPDSGGSNHKNHPFVADIVTPHHPDYYGGKGAATDLDSPVPNAMIGIRGSFLFVLEGDARWFQFTRKLMIEALGDQGIGAKTRAGYGYLIEDKKFSEKIEKEALKQAAAQNYLPAKLRFDAGKQQITAILADGKSTAPLTGEAATRILKDLGDEIRGSKKLKEGKLAVEVTVNMEGNLTQLLDVRLPIA